MNSAALDVLNYRRYKLDCMFTNEDFAYELTGLEKDDVIHMLDMVHVGDLRLKRFIFMALLQCRHGLANPTAALFWHYNGRLNDKFLNQNDAKLWIMQTLPSLCEVSKLTVDQSSI